MTLSAYRVPENSGTPLQSRACHSHLGTHTHSVLADTVGIYLEVHTRILAPLGHTITWERLMGEMGRSAIEVCRNFCREYKLDISPEEYQRRLHDLYPEVFPGTPLMPGTLPCPGSHTPYCTSYLCILSLCPLFMLHWGLIHQHSISTAFMSSTLPYFPHPLLHTHISALIVYTLSLYCIGGFLIVVDTSAYTHDLHLHLP